MGLIMSRRLEELARRKQSLVVQAARERGEVAAAVQKLHSSLDIKQTFAGLGRTLRAHPVIAAGASGMVASGLAGKLFKGAAQLIAVSRVAAPVWAWWKRSRKH